MPAVGCICGNRIGLGGIPSENQLMIISDVDFYKFEDDTIEWDALYGKMTIVAKCDECGRLHVFYDGFGKNPIIYKPEKF